MNEILKLTVNEWISTKYNYFELNHFFRAMCNQDFKVDKRPEYLKDNHLN